jgi:hypothetical protein
MRWSLTPIRWAEGRRAFRPRPPLGLPRVAVAQPLQRTRSRLRRSRRRRRAASAPGWCIRPRCIPAGASNGGRWCHGSDPSLSGSHGSLCSWAPLLSAGYGGAIVVGCVHGRHSSVPATAALSSSARLIALPSFMAGPSGNACADCPARTEMRRRPRGFVPEACLRGCRPGEDWSISTTQCLLPR